jgi:solute carrier family 66 (lysosomal lysine-arginine transporter), member 1
MSAIGVLGGHLALSTAPGFGDDSVFGSGAAVSTLGAGVGPGRVLLQEGTICGDESGPAWENTVGIAIGWGSGVIYMSSRIPQIYKNFKRKSVEGLSPLMFIAAILGNATYGISLLTRLPITSEYIVAKLPFLLGSLGTMFFDTTILCQFLVYKTESKEAALGEVGGDESTQSLLSQNDNDNEDDEAPMITADGVSRRL